jgi:hypothetical protein
MERLTLHAVSLISQLVPLWDLDAYHEHEIPPSKMTPLLCV